MRLAACRSVLCACGRDRAWRPSARDASAVLTEMCSLTLSLRAWPQAAVAGICLAACGRANGHRVSARMPEFESGSPAARLAALGITLPRGRVPMAACVPAERTRARLLSLSVSASTAHQELILALRLRRLWSRLVLSLCCVILALRPGVNQATAADVYRACVAVCADDCAVDPLSLALPLAFGACTLASCRYEHASGGRGAGGRAWLVVAGSIIGGAPRAVSDLAGHRYRHWWRRCAGPGALAEAAGHGDPPGAVAPAARWSSSTSSASWRWPTSTSKRSCT